MARKKWTAKEEVTDSLIRFREKRKWQLAMRRYILERNPSEGYAPYFGLDINNYRKWIELQFIDGLSWDNFGSVWQFDHIVPVAYFDFTVQTDLILCWSFINIRVENLETPGKQKNQIGIIAAKPYFEALYAETGLPLCLKMVEKISMLQKRAEVEPLLKEYINQHKAHLEKLSTLSSDEFMRLNQGTNIDDILLEREIIKKFG